MPRTYTAHQMSKIIQPVFDAVVTWQESRGWSKTDYKEVLEFVYHNRSGILHSSMTEDEAEHLLRWTKFLAEALHHFVPNKYQSTAKPVLHSFLNHPNMDFQLGWPSRVPVPVRHVDP